MLHYCNTAFRVHGDCVPAMPEPDHRAGPAECDQTASCNRTVDLPASNATFGSRISTGERSPLAFVCLVRARTRKHQVTSGCGSFVR